MKTAAKQIRFSAFVGTLICLVAGSVQGAEAHRWTPPKSPNPQAILLEAQSDARNKRYEDALAKHIWFHENALKIDPALYGVRLSFALGYWVDLGKSYPPALDKLKAIRDNDETRIRKGHATTALFHDFVSINKSLGDPGRTTRLFVWLDSNDHEYAKDVYDLAEPALVKSKEYKICGSYLDADGAYKRMLGMFRENDRLIKDARFKKELADFGRKSFSNQVATLVALLVLNDRRDEANRIADKAIKEFDAPEFAEQLEKAKKGHVPEPWP